MGYKGEMGVPEQQARERKPVTLRRMYSRIRAFLSGIAHLDETLRRIETAQVQMHETLERIETAHE